MHTRARHQNNHRTCPCFCTVCCGEQHPAQATSLHPPSPSPSFHYLSPSPPSTACTLNSLTLPLPLSLIIVLVRCFCDVCSGEQHPLPAFPAHSASIHSEGSCTAQPPSPAHMCMHAPLVNTQACSFKPQQQQQQQQQIAFRLCAEGKGWEGLNASSI